MCAKFYFFDNWEIKDESEAAKSSFSAITPNAEQYGKFVYVSFLKTTGFQNYQQKESRWVTGRQEHRGVTFKTGIYKLPKVLFTMIKK